MVVSTPQYGENTDFFSGFPLAESIAKAFCWLILLELQEKKHRLFFMA